MSASPNHPGRLRAELARSLQETSKTKPGLMGWFGSVDHKEIGIRYLVTSFAFLLRRRLEALIMRLQLARPKSTC